MLGSIAQRSAARMARVERRAHSVERAPHSAAAPPAAPLPPLQPANDTHHLATRCRAVSNVSIQHALLA